MCRNGCGLRLTDGRRVGNLLLALTTGAGGTHAEKDGHTHQTEEEEEESEDQSQRRVRVREERRL